MSQDELRWECSHDFVDIVASEGLLGRICVECGFADETVDPAAFDSHMDGVRDRLGAGCPEPPARIHSDPDILIVDERGITLTQMWRRKANRWYRRGWASLRRKWLGEG